MRKFKAGDMVIGNEKAAKYLCTAPGYVGKVLGYYRTSILTKLNGCMKLECPKSTLGYFLVDEDDFDLYPPHVGKILTAEAIFGPKAGRGKWCAQVA